MTNLTKFENWLNRYLDDCNDIKLECELKTIHRQFKEVANNDIRRKIQFNKCANDEVILNEANH